MKTRHLLLALSLAVAPAFTVAAEKSAAAAAAAPAAEAPADNTEIFAEKLKADKKALVAGNMQLTESEAKAFWPIYSEYQAALDEQNKRLGKVVAEYADNYRKGTLTDDVVTRLIADMLAAEQGEVDLRKTFAPKLTKALPPAKALRYLQIENKVRSVVRAQLAQRIPLVGGQPKGKPHAK